MECERSHLLNNKCFQLLFSNRRKLSTIANWPLFHFFLIHFAGSIGRRCSRAAQKNRTKIGKNIHLHASYNAQKNTIVCVLHTQKEAEKNLANSIYTHIFFCTLNHALAWLHSFERAHLQSISHRAQNRSDNWPLKYLNQRASSSSFVLFFCNDFFLFFSLFFVCECEFWVSLCVLFCFTIAVLNLMMCPYTKPITF